MNTSAFIVDQCFTVFAQRRRELALVRQVTITPRMLLSHLSGIRHYEKDAEKVREDHEKAKRLLKPPGGKEEEAKPAAGQSGEAKKKREFDNEEYYLKETFEGVVQALSLFKDDPLIFEPGKSTTRPGRPEP